MRTVEQAIAGPGKVLIAPESMLRAAVAGSAVAEAAPITASRIAIDPETVEDGLVRLVLCLVDTLRRLLERQAIRRVDSGRLGEDEIERLGLTLLRLEERMTELKARFGLADDDLTLRLGSVSEVSSLLDEEQPAPDEPAGTMT